MKTLIYNAQVVLEDSLISDGSIVIENGKIVAVGVHRTTADDTIDASGGFVFPGFIDLHVHGGDSFDFRDGSDEAFRRIGKFHADHGTTSYLLTIGSNPAEKLYENLSNAARFMKNNNRFPSAQILGIHLEGPFVAKQYAGNMNPETIIPPSVEMMQKFTKAAEGMIRLVTLAPELPGADEVIRFLVERNIIVSAGHSGASYEEMERAIRQGVSHVAHCYNAMRGFHHREPSILTSALLNDQVTAEYIGDFIHSHPAAGELLFRTKGYHRVALITDASRYAGNRTGPLRNAAGNLAGSSICMDSALRNVIQKLGIKPWEAAAMTSSTPARIVGIDRCKGSIQPGKDADLVITDREFRVQTTFINGKRGRMV